MPGDTPNGWKPEVVAGGAEALSNEEAFILAATGIMAPSAVMADIFTEEPDEPKSQVVNLDYERAKARVLSGDVTLARDLRDGWFREYYEDGETLRSYVRHIILRVNNDDSFKFDDTKESAIEWVYILKKILQFLDPELRVENLIKAFAADESNPALKEAAQSTLRKLSS